MKNEFAEQLFPTFFELAVGERGKRGSSSRDGAAQTELRCGWTFLFSSIQTLKLAGTRRIIQTGNIRT